MKTMTSRRWLPAIGSVLFLQTAVLAAEQQPTLDERLAPTTGGGLTSDQVATRAQQTSFDAASRREAIRAAEGRLKQAEVAYVPKLTLTARYTRLSPVDPIPIGPGTVLQIPVDQYLTQATLDVPLTDYVLRISQGYASASRNKRAATFDEQAALLNAALNGRLAYYSWLRARAEVVVSERALDQAKGHLEDARHAFDVGTASKADVLRVESQVATAELVLERAKNLADLTEDQIRTAMHDPSSQRYGVGEDLRAELPPMAGRESLAGLRAEAFDKRLEVRALDETAWSFREQAKALKAGYFPRIDAIADAIYAKPNPRIFIPSPDFKWSWDVGVQLVWTPNDSFAAPGAVSEAEAHAAQTEMQKAALRDTINLEVIQAYQAVREAEVAAQTTARGLAAAEEGYRVRRELFRNGRATSVELTDSEVELYGASRDAIDARVDLRSSRARLVHATGRDIPQGVASR